MQSRDLLRISPRSLLRGLRQGILESVSRKGEGAQTYFADIAPTKNANSNPGTRSNLFKYRQAEFKERAPEKESLKIYVAEFQGSVGSVGKVKTALAREFIPGFGRKVKTALLRGNSFQGSVGKSKRLYCEGIHFRVRSESQDVFFVEP